MDKIRSSFRLLALFSIFFIYKAITGNNSNDIIIWSLITIVYMISLAIMYFVIRLREKEQKI